ncbi:hypothetical protein [Azospirillum sp. TSO22-1]|uniref:hypothetical protein n=1 Tax=Azospirillum sp. TSO22-1 TaxID=716789 RepID=UPI000D614126|nr:hypothetical protein [Azospirillum sp. TSO22-1]PWC53606.1 hypothetical protein TSO221_10265 [Azospirillum sp. TSO22-1]
MKPFEREAVFFLLNHLLSGMAGAVVLGLGLLVCDVANLRTLIFASESAFVAAFLLFASLMITFGSVAMGIGIMSMGWDGRPDD